jgi:hypothetical protein
MSDEKKRKQPNNRNKILFEEAKALFEESNCKLLHLKEDFFSIYKNC